MTRIPEEHAHEVARLYYEVASDLHRYGCRVSQGDTAVADDLVQETFHDAARSWSSLRTVNLDRQRAWLFRVLKNKAVTRWRQSVRPANSAATAVDVVSDVVSDADDTSDKALNSIALNRCWEILKSMPAQRFRCSYLRWHAGWSTSEVAAHLGISQSTVRVHIKNARDELTIAVGPDVVFLDVDDDFDSGKEARRDAL